MKSQSNRPDISEMPPYRLGRHWNTIQAYLIPGIEDDIGELSEEMKKFMGICELLIDDMGAKFVNIVPAEAVRYRIRTGVERVFGMLKDSHGRAVCQLEHLRIRIYTIYTFYTAIKEGFATASYISEWSKFNKHFYEGIRISHIHFYEGIFHV